VPIPGRLRPARPGDVAEILVMVRELADYEREPDAVRTTEAQLQTLLFGLPEGAPGAPDDTPAPGSAPRSGAAFAHVVEHPEPGSDRALGGFALWFLSTSTWTGTHGIYVEDLYVREQLRGRGYGRALLAVLARTCLEQGYQRLEWSVLDWNRPAWDFYASLGAQPMDEWTVHRVSGDALVQLAAHDPAG
jgi:GNAT superfamily N-acetyltransferase